MYLIFEERRNFILSSASILIHDSRSAPQYIANPWPWVVLSFTFKSITMIIVHDIFVCKPGNASKLAKKFKEGMSGFSELKHIMTDMTGQFNRVILVTEYESLTAYEQSWKKYEEDSEANRKMQEVMQGYQDMYLTGSREIFKTW